MTTPTVAIIGAGTAGLASAIALAQVGCRVTVYEKHRSLAAIGAGVLIQPQGVAALDQLGVGAAFRDVSVPIARLLGTCHRGWTLVDIAYPDMEARAVSRANLGAVLLEAARAAGAELRFGAAIGAHAGAAFHAGGQPIEDDAIVIANGASSDLPRQAGLAIHADRYPWGALWGMFDVDDWPRHLLEQRYRTTRQMFGIMPTEVVGGRLRVSLFWSLHGRDLETWRAAPIAAFRRELLDLWPAAAPVVEQIVRHDQLTFASYYHARPARLARPPVCIVGDAAHAMSPQLGLGSTLAVQDALALAAALRRHGPVDGLVEYSRRRRRAVRAYQSLSCLLTPCFQADGNGLWRDLLFAAGLYMPGVRQLMYRSVASPQSRPAPGAPPARAPLH